MLGPIRTYLFEKEKKKKAGTGATRAPHFKKLQPNHYGILFDAGQIDHRQEVMHFADDLRKKGNRVKILGYIEGRAEALSLPFDVFTSAERHKLSGIPRSPLADAFAGQHFDVLINMSIHHNHKPLEYLAAVSHASFRIGPWYEERSSSPYDLCLDTGSAATLREWITELMHTLEKIY